MAAVTAAATSREPIAPHLRVWEVMTPAIASETMMKTRRSTPQVSHSPANQPHAAPAATPKTVWVRVRWPPTTPSEPRSDFVEIAVATVEENLLVATDAAFDTGPKVRASVADG